MDEPSRLAARTVIEVLIRLRHADLRYLTDDYLARLLSCILQLGEVVSDELERRRLP